MATGDQTVYFNRGDQRTELNEKHIKRMIDYLTERTEYKILKNFKYWNRLHTVHPLPQESVPVQDQKIKIRNVKFEDQSQMQNQLTKGHTSVVYDATNVKPRFTFFPGKKNQKVNVFWSLEKWR